MQSLTNHPETAFQVMNQKLTLLSNQNPPHQNHGRSGHFDLKLMPLAWLGRFQLRLTLYD